MKTSLKANLLKHLIAKKEEGGFTLIELLVVIIIIGILAAIALPSFLNQANKAKQSEARTYVGSINRAQQAYYLENNGFSDKLDLLGLGVASQTANYKYVISRATTGAGASGAGPYATAQALPSVESAPSDAAAVKGYVGGVILGEVGAGTSTEATTLGVVCETAKAPANGGLKPVAGVASYTFKFNAAQPSCSNTTDWKQL